MKIFKKVNKIDLDPKSYCDGIDSGIYFKFKNNIFLIFKIYKTYDKDTSSENLYHLFKKKRLSQLTEEEIDSLKFKLGSVNLKVLSRNKYLFRYSFNYYFDKPELTLFAHENDRYPKKKRLIRRFLEYFNIIKRKIYHPIHHY